MSSSSETRTSLERIIESTSQIVSITAFLGMIWLAVSIFDNPEGPKEITRYYYDHFTNFVDPSVNAAVTVSTSGMYTYDYTIGNALWALQDVREVAIEAEPRFQAESPEDWQSGMIFVAPLKSGIGWRSQIGGVTDNGISRGEAVDGFILKSSTPPVIAKVFAGNRLISSGMFGIMSDITTPAGKRTLRWTVAPGPQLNNPEKLIARLISQVKRAGELGWIRDAVLVGRISEALHSALNSEHRGDHAYASSLLRHVITILEGSNETELSDEARTLITLNVEAALAVDVAGRRRR